MTDILPNLGLTSHFAQRFKHYLLFLEVTNDQELLCSLLEFLTIRELLAFAASSTHFRKFLQIQGIEVRVLRAKLQCYQKPKLMASFDPLLHCFSYNMAQQKPEIKNERLSKGSQTLKKFNKGVRFYQYLKKQGVVENKESFKKMLETKGYNEFSNFYDQFHLQQKPEELKLVVPVQKKGEWSGVKQNQLSTFKKYQEYFQNEKNSHQIITQKQKTINTKKNNSELNPYISRMQQIQYNYAKADYEKRKLKRIQQRELQNLFSEKEMRKLAEIDPCSRQIYNKVFKQDKQKWQRKNVQQLRMGPTPAIDPKIIQKMSSQKIQKLVVVKQSLTGKLMTGIKGFFFYDKKSI